MDLKEFDQLAITVRKTIKTWDVIKSLGKLLLSGLALGVICWCIFYFKIEPKFPILAAVLFVGLFIALGLNQSLFKVQKEWIENSKNALGFLQTFLVILVGFQLYLSGIFDYLFENQKVDVKISGVIKDTQKPTKLLDDVKVSFYDGSKKIELLSNKDGVVFGEQIFERYRLDDTIQISWQKDGYESKSFPRIIGTDLILDVSHRLLDTITANRNANVKPRISNQQEQDSSSVRDNIPESQTSVEQDTTKGS